MLLEESGIEWIGTQPSKWKVDRIKDVIPKVFGGGTPDSSEPEYWEDGSIVWITPTDFQDYENELLITNSRRKITEKGLKSCSAILLPAGTVIMASRATIGDVKIAGTELCTNQGFISFVCEKLSNNFFYYLIKAYLGDLFVNIAPGTTFKEIGRNAVKKEYIVFPGIDEQRRIAAYLDKTCAAIDTSIEKKQNQIETLNALRKSIIHKAVTRGLDDSVELKESWHEWLGTIPSKWKLIALKRIVSTKITDGPHETPELSDEGIQFISAEAIKNNQIDFDLRRGFISLELHQQYCRKCKPQKRDIFIIKSGATTGNVAYVDVDFEFSIWSPLALVRCNEHIAFYKFIFYVLLTDVFRKQVELSWSFGTQQNIGMRVIERIKVPIPPIAEQKKIAAFLDDETFRISEIRANIESQISTLTAYRKSLIHECVTGKRRITETDVARIKTNDNSEQ